MEQLLRKIAWTFSKSSRIDFEELLAEANLAYVEALRTHDDSKGKLTTYIWHSVEGKLRNYVSEEAKHHGLSCDEVELLTYSEPYYERLTQNAQCVADVVLSSPDEFIHLKKPELRKQVIKTMLARDYSFKTIFRGLRELSIIYS